MRCHVTLLRGPDGIVARCAEFPACEGRGGSPAEALGRLRDSVLFWLETCPCDQTAAPGLVFDVVEERGGR